MSLQSVSDLSNEIETIVDADKNLWFKRAHAGKCLGMKDIKHNFRDFPSQYTGPRSSICLLNEPEVTTRNAIKPRRKDQKHEWDIFFYQGKAFCM